MKFILSLIIILLLCITPIYAEKNKGLFSGDILQADLDAFTDSTADTPSYADQQTPEKTNLQDIGEWIEIGKSQLKSGNWAGAEESFSRVTKQESDNDIGWEGYLLAIRGGGDFHKLIAASEEAAQKNPDYGAIWKYQGIAYSGLDKPEEALSAFDKALEIDPDYYMALYYKGLALVSLKRYTEAVSAFEQVVKAEPAYAKAWNNMGVAFNYLGMYKDAINAFDKAYELDPSLTQAYENRAIAIEEQKQGNLGLGDIFDDALSLTPSKPEVSVVPISSPVLTVPPTMIPITIPTFPLQTTPVETSRTKSSLPPNIEWQKTFEGSDNDIADSIIQTSNSGYILAGSTYSIDTKADIWVVKYNSDEAIEWQKTIGGSKNDWGYFIAQTSDGGFILTGVTQSEDGNIKKNREGNDILLVKFSSDGTIEWQKTIGGSNMDSSDIIAQTIDGGYILTGWTSSNDGDIDENQGDKDAWVVKLSNNGEIEWQKTIGGSKGDYGNSIKQTSDGGYILTGFTVIEIDDDPRGKAQILLVKLSNNGEIEWQKTIGESKGDVGNSIVQTTDGGFILTGYSRDPDVDVRKHGEEDVCIIKLSKMGAIEWQKTIGGSEDDEGKSIVQTTDGGYILIGTTSSNDGDVKGNHGNKDTWFVKLSSNGTIEWQKTIGGTDDDEGKTVAHTIDGGYIITGTTHTGYTDYDGGSLYNYDIWVVKLTP